ncbi:MAG: pyruvate:ferredoxin (flavodoxin) oxidoreductase [Acidimicrobiales bacterium]
MSPSRITVDGNEAVARIAHALSEVVAIYPITPASPMGEAIDAWAEAGRTNMWGSVPTVIEMQSEAGAAGAVHGSAQAGALTTTFTASQGLLLMIPNLYKIAGELTPAVIHVAARSVATHALSIFGDHSDVMAIRPTGVAMLSSGSVQEAQDLALVAHAATLVTRVPFVHFFDGFRTSHEVATITALDDSDVRALVDDAGVDEHRRRSLDPSRPDVRGTAQNPDVFFQAREAANPYHADVSRHVQATMDALAQRTGRRYGLFDYSGAPDATDVVVIMGSGAGTTTQAVRHLLAEDRRVGVVTVRLYRPFDVDAFDAALPATTERVAVLDRTKEPGSVGEPLYLDVVAALARSRPHTTPDVVGGRYGLSSKEYTPAMAIAVFDMLAGGEPRHPFTVGIVDDVTGLSLPLDDTAWSEPDDVMRAVFHGLGSDGTVGANKNSVKIVGEHTDLHAQGYFVYDSRKSGSMTTSHLRFSPRPIDSAYLIDDAHFVACHDFGFLERSDVLTRARRGATFLLNSPWSATEVWAHLPAEVQERIIELDLDLWVVDADRVAHDAGLGGRINTVLQTCFFALTDLVETEAAVGAIKDTIAKTYSRRGRVVVARNNAAVDAALDGLEQVTIPATATSSLHRRPAVPEAAPDFVQRVTAAMLADRGDLLPVSALPVDGRFPPGTTRWEKRGLAAEIPIWDPDICIDCGRCALVCPHAAIRMTISQPDDLVGAPEGFVSKPLARADDATRLMVQVAPDDCTGCGVCVSVCPAKSREEVRHRAIDMEPRGPHLERERLNFAFFEQLPVPDRTSLALDTVKGSQLTQPLFEFSGACSGCGETPYLKLLTQLFGDRLVVANATGCSSIYGANLPTTPWAANDEGNGAAWINSLFEDNAEFGLGIRIARDHLTAEARSLLGEIVDEVGPLGAEILTADQSDEAGLAEQRRRVAVLRSRLANLTLPPARRLLAIAEHLVRSSVWIVGGDGWAYDIGFGGLDHVLAAGRDVNVLVLDTEVYSNTGGQTSKATPRAAIAKFSAGGKNTAKKDLGVIAMAHPDVYVAHVAMGANMTQVVKAFAEAEAHPGPSIIIAYSPCIAHGIDMGEMIEHQKLAAETGYWPLYRYDPRRERQGEHALRLDGRAPTRPFAEFAAREGRFAMLARANPARAEELMAAAQADIDDRWHLYEQMVEIEHTATYGIVDDDPHAADDGEGR